MASAVSRMSTVLGGGSDALVWPEAGCHVPVIVRVYVEIPPGPEPTQLAMPFVTLAGDDAPGGLLEFVPDPDAVIIHDPANTWVPEITSMNATAQQSRKHLICFANRLLKHAKLGVRRNKTL